MEDRRGVRGASKARQRSANFISIRPNTEYTQPTPDSGNAGRFNSLPMRNSGEELGGMEPGHSDEPSSSCHYPQL